MPLPELFSVMGHSFTPLGVAVLATAILVVALGLYPLLGDEPFEESLFFLFFCLGVSVWLTGFGWAYGAPDAGRALQWMRVAYLGVPIIPAALYTVCVASLGIAHRRRWALAALWSLSAFFVVQSVGVGSIFDGVTRYGWGWFPEFTPAGLALIAFTGGGVGAGLWEYWERYRTATGEQERARAGRFLTAFCVGSLAMVDYLPAYGVEAYPAGFLAVLAMSVVVGRTIRSYRLTEFTPAFAADRILGTMSDPVLVCDLGGRIRVANRAATDVLGYAREDLLGREIREVMGGRAGTGTAWGETIGENEVTDEEVELIARDGTPIHVSVSSSGVHEEGGDRVGTAVVARDIRERKELEEQLRHHALHDRLTGLPNRALYEDRLEQMLRLSDRRTGSTVGVLYVDLDRFKAINDTMGHPAGDRVLRHVGQRVRRAIREGDTAARLGGDEFAVVLADLNVGNGIEKARQVAGRIVDEIGRPVPADGSELRVAASVGIAVADGDAPSDGEELTRRADLAMYAAKTDPKRNVARFRPELKRKADRQMVVERDLSGVADRGELRLEYQPVVGLRSERPVAFEALLRWDHPDLGRLPPRAFIPAAEESGMIRELGGWVLRNACEQMQQWRENGTDVPDDARVMVNASPGEVESGAYVDRVRDALERSGLPPGALEVELTERTVADDPGAVAETLSSLRELGVRTSIDDFGTGVASLRMLRQLHMDGLKVDRTFVHRLAEDERGQKFIRSILDLAGELELDVVAEGVEEPSDLEALRDLGVLRAQGFLWSEPVPPEAVESHW